MGLQRSELSLRRARRLALRQQQFQEVHQLLRAAVRQRQEEQRENLDAQAIQNVNNINMVISEQQEQQEEQEDDNSAPYGLEF
jgi:hypothetical protein